MTKMLLIVIISNKLQNTSTKIATLRYLKKTSLLIKYVFLELFNLIQVVYLSKEEVKIMMLYDVIM